MILRRTPLLLVLSGVVSLLAALLVPAGAVTGDVSAPVLRELLIEPRAIDTTTQDVVVSYRARVTDDLSGVASARFHATGPGGQQTMSGYGVLESGDAFDGWWHATVVFERGTEPGRWESWVSLADAAGNHSTLWPSLLAEQGHDGHVDVTDADPDLDAPKVVALTVSPALVDVREGEASTTVDFRVTDDHTGAHEVYLNLTGPDGGAAQAHRTYPALLSGDRLDGWWRSVVTVPEHAHSGHWTFVVTLLDDVGNRSDWYAADLAEAGLPDGFDVVSVDDHQAPIVESLTIRPGEANVADGDQVVEFELVVTDDVAGVSYLQIGLRHPLVLQEKHPPLSLVEGDAHRGRYRGSVVVPRHSATGLWTISLFATDAAANGEWLHTADLVERSLPGTLLVYNVPGAPRDVVAVPGAGSIDLGWEPPADDGGKAVDGFRYTIEPGGHTAEVGAAETSAVLAGLAPGEYVVSVSARNAAGYGSPTSTSVVVPAPADPPAPDPEPDAGPPPPPAPAPAPPAPATPPPSGYWMLRRDGIVHPFGDARDLGSAPRSSNDAVDIEATPSGGGYWVLAATGEVRGFGDARLLAGAAWLSLGETAVSLSATPSGAGYWVFTSAGRALPFGDARFHGDLAGKPLNAPVLDSVVTPSGLGYYLVAADGGVFTFGDAAFAGSMGAIPLNAPVQSLVPDPDGVGYWLVAADGGIFSFDAPFHGSMGHVPLNRPVTGMVGSHTGQGYLMVAEDGGIFSFGDIAFHGSLGASPPPEPVVAVASL